MKAVQLPPEFRAVAWIAFVGAALSGMGASGEAWATIMPRPLEESLAAAKSLPVHAMPEGVMEVMLRTQYEVIEAMRGPRAVVLFALSFFAALAVIAALQLLYPGELPREGRRRVAGMALLIAGVLRTLDGAMQLVINRRIEAAVRKAVSPSDATAANALADPAMVAALSVGFGVALTVLMVVVLIGTGQYLRSERAKQIVQTVDAATFGPAAG